MCCSNDSNAHSWPDPLEAPDPARVKLIFDLYWKELDGLPTLIHANENLLAEALTTRLRNLVLEMMLALNGIAFPQNTSNLNAYLGDSQREAIEKTLVADSAGSDTWIGPRGGVDRNLSMVCAAACRNVQPRLSTRARAAGARQSDRRTAAVAPNHYK